MEMSYGEKSAWASLSALVGAFGWYLYSNVGALIDGSLSSDDIPSEMIGLVILIVIVEVVVRAIFGTETTRKDRGGSKVDTDERDAFIDARSDRWPYLILFSGAIAGIGTAAVKSPIVTAHVLLGTLVAAELVKLIAQLVYYRRGV